MRIAEALKVHRDRWMAAITMRERKAHDYSTDDDVLSNFKTVAGICGVFAKYGTPIDTTTPLGCAMFLIILKLTRIMVLITLRKGAAANEPLGDSFVDAEVYLEIANELAEEEYATSTQAQAQK